MPKLESVDELFANIDINSFIIDYNLGSSNKKLQTKYNIRSAISLQNLITSLVKEKKIKEISRDSKKIKNETINDNINKISNKDSQTQLDFEIKNGDEKQEQEILEEIEIELMLERGQ